MRLKRLTIIILLILLGLGMNAQSISRQISSLKARISQTGSSTLKAQYYIKLGSLYQQIDSIDQAINSFENALRLIGNSRNYPLLFQLNSFLGVLYSEKADYASSEKYFSNAVKYARKLGRKNRISQALLNLGNAQRNLGKYQDAIATYEDALSIAFDQNNLQLIKQAYTYIAMCYKALGDNNRYYKYFNLSVAIDKKLKEQIIKQKEEEARKQRQLAQQKEMMLELQKYQMKNVQDSLRRVRLQNEQNKMRIALLEKEAQLKELQMKQREAELKKKEAEQKVARIIIISLSVLIFIILMAGLIVYKQYHVIKKKNQLLAELNTALKETNRQLEIQNQIIEEQKKELEWKNKQIRDSIEYASKIQRAILPSTAAIKENFPEGEFIFYLPRDVVSGDFYWFSNQGQYKFLALVDCTGHSVPGAFMSLIGNTLLNEIVNSKHIFDPSKVLLELHTNLVKLLHKNQEEKDDQVHDGMDIALLRFEPKKNELIFASANQPLFLVYQDGRLEQVDGDIFSIGGYFGNFNLHFKNIILPLEEGTNIYLSSDGYFDQFNGETKEKFTRKRFIELLKKIYTLPFNVQYKKILDTFNEWKGGYRQVDDVLVIGLRYSSEVMKKSKIYDHEKESIGNRG